MIASGETTMVAGIETGAICPPLVMTDDEGPRVHDSMRGALASSRPQLVWADREGCLDVGGCDDWLLES